MDVDAHSAVTLQLLARRLQQSVTKWQPRYYNHPYCLCLSVGEDVLQAYKARGSILWMFE